MSCNNTFEKIHNNKTEDRNPSKSYTNWIDAKYFYEWKYNIKWNHFPKYDYNILIWLVVSKLSD